MTLSTTSLAEQLLKLFCEKIENQYIIIDGLDECEPAQRKLVLSIFTTMVDRCDEHDPGKLRVLFISQDCLDIRKVLANASVLQITSDDNKNDIRTYINGESRKIQEKYGLDDKIAGYIQETTFIRSQGN